MELKFKILVEMNVEKFVVHTVLTMGIRFMVKQMKRIFDYYYQLQYDTVGWLVNKEKILPESATLLVKKSNKIKGKNKLEKHNCGQTKNYLIFFCEGCSD